MVLLVTSASGSNGAGYGKLLTFNENGQLLGPFTEDIRISGSARAWRRRRIAISQ
jgi:hypothetical protein